MPLNQYASTYSSGMKQRVKFAASILTSPPVLILDEPSTNLDLAGIKMVKKYDDGQTCYAGLLIFLTIVFEAIAIMLNILGYVYFAD